MPTTTDTPTTEAEFEEAATFAFTLAGEEDPEFEGAEIRSFADAGILTRNAGLVVRLANGAEFQVTIVQSAEATR